MSVAEIEIEKTYLAGINLNSFFDEVVFDELAYQGFDPLALLAELRKRGAEAGVSDEEHHKNMAWLAALGTMRGTNLKKIKGKTSTAGVTKLTSLISIYKIIVKPVSLTDASLSRIAACFARQISHNASRDDGRLISPVPVEKLVEGYPRALRVTSAGSLIPRAECWETHNDFLIFLDAFALHQYEFDRVINPRKEKQSDTKTIKNYVSIQVASKLYSDETRKGHWINLNILKKVSSQNSKVIYRTDAIKNIFQAASEKWDEIAMGS